MPLQIRLKELLGTDLDEEVYDYVEGVIREYESSGLLIEDVRDILCGFSDAFSQLPEQEQDEAVASLLSLRDAEPSAVEAPSSDAKLLLDDHYGYKDKNQIQISSTLERTTTLEGVVPPPPPPPPADLCREEVTLLASLCPISVPEDYLAHVFINQSNRDLQTAANKILEQGPEVLQAEVIVWESANANTSSSNSNGNTKKVMTGNSPLKPDEELRRSIVARFHLEAIPTGGSGSGSGKGGKPTKLAAWGTQQNSSQNNGSQKLRYRDGVVVATKGEKFIVEKEPEWDGGSRGRVKSKRKGGVGWQ